MLRNWTERVPAGALNAGHLVAGTPYVGHLGSAILSQTEVGDDGPGGMYGAGMDPAKRYRMILQARTNFPAGTLLVDELGALVATQTGATAFRMTEDNVYLSGSAPLVVRIGT